MTEESYARRGVIMLGTAHETMSGVKVKLSDLYLERTVAIKTSPYLQQAKEGVKKIGKEFLKDERGDVPGWVLVVLMTTGLITAIWAVAEPRLSQLRRNSLDSMNTVR